MKRSFRSSQGLSSDLTADKNAQRDVQTLFEDTGFTLDIPVHQMEHETDHTRDLVTTYHMKPQDWVKHWLDNSPELLGGKSGPAFDNFKTFWDVYQLQHPTHDVYRTHAGELDRVIPLCLHGDEGRALKKTTFFVFSIESPLGAIEQQTFNCDCEESLAKHPRLPCYGVDAKQISPEVLAKARRQVTNMKGHSYLSKWLLFGVGGWLYKTKPQVIDKLLDQVAQNLHEFFHEGVTLADGKKVYAAVISLKGDMDFHRKVVALDRSYGNLGTKNQIAICHHCHAGMPDFPFEEYAESPAWSSTLWQTRPWSSTPYLAGIPYDPDTPERMMQGDLFHIFKCGLGRDIIGGVVILLLRQGWADFEGSTVNLPDRFKRAHSRFVLWCSACSEAPGLRSFGMLFFNMASLLSAPWTNSKGSDTVLLLRWLDFELKLLLKDPAEAASYRFVREMSVLVSTSLEILSVHKHRLWLERECARKLYVSIMRTLRAYAALSKRALLELEIRVFMQKPKAHALHHLAWSLKCELESGATLILSPAMNSCEMNEDFVGRVSRLSRRVNTRVCDLRVFQRMSAKIASLLQERRGGRRNFSTVKKKAKRARIIKKRQRR